MVGAEDFVFTGRSDRGDRRLGCVVFDVQRSRSGGLVLFFDFVFFVLLLIFLLVIFQFVFGFFFGGDGGDDVFQLLFPLLVVFFSVVQSCDSGGAVSITADFYFIKHFGVVFTAAEADGATFFFADRFVVKFVALGRPVFVFILLVFFVLVLILFAVKPLHESVDQSEGKNGRCGQHRRRKRDSAGGEN